MTDEPLTTQDVQHALELAEVYLDDAEQLLWTASRRSDDLETTEVATDLTYEVWDLQHSLADARERLGRDPATAEEVESTQ